MPAVRVFSQAPFPPTSEVELVSRARAHFQADLSFETRQLSDRGARFAGLFTRRGTALAFAATVRASAQEDYREADEAELRGKAGGMASLARRCGSVWVIEAEDEPLDWLFLALLASVLLGPILPADGSTLFGVRGARVRSEEAEARRLARGAVS